MSSMATVPTFAFATPISPPSSAAPPRRSSSMHRNIITKLRPLPFQYVWALWHSKVDASSSTFSSHLSLLAEQVADIATFYRIYNNFPWSDIKLKDSVHIFRAGVKPLWEDAENRDGGCWVLKVRKEDNRAVNVWEEICVMACGGELQTAITTEHDHLLGMSYSPRLYWAHISIWTKKGDNLNSIDLLEKTVLERLSPHLRPQSSGDYYYKKHSDHEGWKEAVAAVQKT